MGLLCPSLARPPADGRFSSSSTACCGVKVARLLARQEVEVDSLAFIVLSALDLESDAYSFPYVARWAGGDVKVVAETGTRVVSCTEAILDQLESVGLTTSPA